MNQLVVAALVGLLVAAPEARNPEDAVKRLMSETPATARKASEVEADYRLAIDYLAAGLAGDDVTRWERWDPRLERLCHHAATPGLDVHRLAATKALLAHVKDPKLTTKGRFRIIRYIGMLGREEAVGPLAALLEDKALREAARRALMRIPIEAASEALRKALVKADPDFKPALIDALTYRGDRKAVEAILTLATSGDEKIRTHAVESVARLGDEKVAEAIKAATSKGSWWAKHQATDSLLALAERLAASGKKQTALTIYRSFLGGRTFLRCAALIGIGKAGSAADVPTLVAALGDPEPQVRAAATEALVALPDKKAGPGIVKAIAGTSTEVQAAAVRIIGRRGDRAMLPELMKAARSQVPAVRAAACEALGHLKAEEGVEVLVKAAERGSGEEREKALWALARIPGRKPTKALLAALKTASGEGKAALVRALGDRKDKSLVGVLVAATKDPGEAVRVAALQALAPLSDPQAVPAILDALANGQGPVLEAATYAIRCTRGEEARGALARAAKTAPPQALAVILGILSCHPGPEVGELVLSCARHSDPRVRAAAFEALRRVKEPAAAPLIAEAATKGEGAVRSAALRAAIAYAAEIARSDPAVARRLLVAALDRKAVPDTEERRQALRALGEVGGVDEVDALAQALRDRRLSGEAHNAAFKIAARLRGENRKAGAREVYLKVALLSPDERQIRRAQTERKKLGATGNLAQQVGFITRWRVCGPFPNGNNSFFSAKLPVEADPSALARPASWGGAERRWKPLQVADTAGVVDLAQLFGKEANTGALLHARVVVKEGCTALLKLGYEEGCVAYVNGQRVHGRAGARFRVDDQRAKAVLKPGANDILLKVTHLVRGWRACARLVTADNRPVAFTQSDQGHDPRL